MKPKKITLQYKCRRCDTRYFDSTASYFQSVEQIRETPALMTAIHDCDDHGSGDKTRFGIADLIGCKVEEI